MRLRTNRGGPNERWRRNGGATGVGLAPGAEYAPKENA